jgi:hypothetical protein
MTYEDAPYENDRDLATRITIVNGGQQKLLTGPPIVDFTVTFSAIDTNPYLAAQRLLTAYISASLPGEYKVVQATGRVDVVPSRVLGRDGRMRDIEPIMSRPVTFPLGTRSVEDTLQLLVQKVSNESGSKVILLDPLFWPTYTIQVSSDGQSAADLISAIGAQLRVPLSFRCFYDADEKAYYLRIQAVVPPSPPDAPVSIKNAGSTQQNSPWFYKAQ